MCGACERLKNLGPSFPVLTSKIALYLDLINGVELSDKILPS